MKAIGVWISLGWLALASCYSSSGPQTSGNTNWLKLCSTDRGCGDGASCVCGVCTRSCDASEDLNRDGLVVRRNAVQLGLWFRLVLDNTERTTLHVLTPQVALALQRSQVVVDTIGRTNPHVLADLAQGRRIAPLPNRGADEVESLLLALGKTLHSLPILLNGCFAVKLSVALCSVRC